MSGLTLPAPDPKLRQAEQKASQARLDRADKVAANLAREIERLKHSTQLYIDREQGRRRAR